MAVGISARDSCSDADFAAGLDKMRARVARDGDVKAIKAAAEPVSWCIRRKTSAAVQASWDILVGILLCS
jgi:hypothetical protein